MELTFKSKRWAPSMEFIQKIPLAMRLTLVLLFSLLLNLQATEVFSQSATVSLDLNKVTVEQVLNAIERQSGLYFVYNSKLINVDRVVSIHSKKKPVEAILKELFNEGKVTYEIGEKHIVLSPSTSQLQSVLQEKKITGVVKDATGEPIIGANVTLKGVQNVGTVTDLDGHFSLNIPLENETLLISYIGYLSQEIPIGNKSNFNIILKEDAKALDEVVVVGFVTQKKANVTGAVSQVSMDKTLADRPVTSLGSALQGAMPGFTASTETAPGGANNFNIRGENSINGGSPLVLVDNVIFNDLNLLNPADIESVTVLKDASSAAIYGARASFGVILITTKKAKRNETLTINYNNNFAVSNVSNQLKLASPVDMIQTLKDGGYTSIWSGQNIDTYLDLLHEYNANPSLYPKGWTDMNGTKYFLCDTGVQREMFETGFQQTHNLSAQGGSEHINYRMSASYTKQDGILVTNKDAFDRVNVTSYVNGDITKWLSTSLNISYSKGNKTYPIDNGDLGSIFKTNLPSYHPVGNLPYGADGEEYPVMSPANLIRLLNASKKQIDDTRILSRTVLKPFKGFEAVLEYSYQIGNTDYEQYTNKFEVHQGLAEAIKPSTANTPFNMYKESTRYTTINAFATYEKDFNDVHYLSALVGFNQEKNDYRKLESTAYNMISNELPSISGSDGSTPPITRDSYDQYGLRSGFFRATYNFMHRYFLEFNGRYDLSSKFPKGHRGGFFPSVSAGWSLVDEPFLKSITNVVSTLKIRGSYGTLGNQAIDNYGYLPTLGIVEKKDLQWIYNGTLPITLNAPGMVRANYTWEKVKTFNLGLDFGFLENKLNGAFEIYRRNTIGMLGPVRDFPAVAGATAPKQNAADMKTNGWELSINWRDRIGKVNYGVGFNIYDSYSEITKYENENKAFASEDDKTFYVGKQMGEIWGYITDGFYTADDFDATGALKEGVVRINGVTSHPGDIKYKNLRDDETHVNVITNGDNSALNPGDMVRIGNKKARYQYGANGFVEWKGFNFSFILQGVGKRDAWLDGAITFPMTDQYGVVYAHQVGKVWTEDNPNAFYGRIYENAGSSQSANQRKSDKFLYNAAYLRVKNISLSYTFPQKLIQPLYLKGLKVFFSGENLFTFDHLPDGVDPENLNWSYPHSKTYSFGINLTL